MSTPNMEHFLRAAAGMADDELAEAVRDVGLGRTSHMGDGEWRALVLEAAWRLATRERRELDVEVIRVERDIEVAAAASSAWQDLVDSWNPVDRTAFDHWRRRSYSPSAAGVEFQDMPLAWRSGNRSLAEAVTRYMTTIYSGRITAERQALRVAVLTSSGPVG